MRSGPLGGACCTLAVLLLAACGDSDSPTATRVGERKVSAAQQVSTQDATDALFLGSGPAIPRDGQTACALSGVWTGFPRGASVRVRLAPAVPGPARDAVRRVAEQVAGATQGVLTA